MSPPRTAAKRVTTSTLAEGAHAYPPFYACYMLRSFKDGKMNRRTYIGSTPDPPRRWRQHNGNLQGGAFKTKFWRPWEMDVICYDFPSKLVALQFEWAWNAPYKSRHLRQLDSDNKPAARFPKAIGTGPEARIRVLQAMLATAPWRRYPLKVMLFSEDARDIWNRCARGELYKKGSKKWTPTGGNTEDLSLVDVSERFAGVDGHRLVRRGLGDATERTLSVADGDAVIESFEKLQHVLVASAHPSCGLCAEAVNIQNPLSYTVCAVTPTCHHIAHLSCLAAHFLDRGPPDQVLPDRAECPGCHQPVRWGQLVKAAFHRQPVKPSATRPTTSRKSKKMVDPRAGSDDGTVEESPTRRKRKTVPTATKVSSRARAGAGPLSRKPAARAKGTKKSTPRAVRTPQSKSSDESSPEDFRAALDAITESDSTPPRKRRSPARDASSVDSIGSTSRAVGTLELSPTRRKRKLQA